MEAIWARRRRENDFEVVVTGELILRWTSKDRNDIYRYQTRGFESGDFAAFGIMIILKNPAFVPRMALGKKNESIISKNY